MKVPYEEGKGVDEFNTDEDVFLQVSKNLSERFRLAFSAPSYSGNLFDNFGYIGDTEATQKILEGTYAYPEDTDPATRLLCEEAS